MNKKKIKRRHSYTQICNNELATQHCPVKLFTTEMLYICGDSSNIHQHLKYDYCK